MTRTAVIATVAIITTALLPARADETQAQVSAPVGTTVLKAHAVGAQIYDCKSDGRGGLTWSFREPIATLLVEGKTVGRHFAGPSWEMAAGSLVTGKVVEKAPGTSADDIPWLRLEVTTNQGDGVLKGVTVVQRVATAGGNETGPCASVGALISVPYAADYVFSRP